MPGFHVLWEYLTSLLHWPSQAFARRFLAPGKLLPLPPPLTPPLPHCFISVTGSCFPLGVVGYGWVARIYNLWERTSSRSCRLPIMDAPRHPGTQLSVSNVVVH